MRVVLVLYLPLAAAACEGEDNRSCPSVAGLRVVVGSLLSGPATIEPGRTAACGDDRDTDKIIEQAARAYLKAPEQLRPSSLTVHLKPRAARKVAPVRGIEFHRPSRSLLVESAPADQGTWLHEMAHVRMGAKLPEGPFGQRLFAALEEGVADYYAAAITGNALVGGVRDLQRPPRLRPGQWESLALKQLSFEPQEMGWVLAAQLYRTEPRPGRLLEDLIACMARSLPRTTGDTPRSLIKEWLQNCPARSRNRIRAILQNWIPEQLMGG